MDELIQEQCQPLYRFLLRLCGNDELANDLAQESLVCAWQNRHQLRDSHNFRGWLFRIGLNVWRDHCRRPSRGEPLCEEPTSTELTPEQHVTMSEMGQAVWEAISKLPIRQKQVLHLRVIDQMEISEIAATLDISSQLVRSNLSAARKKLRARFTNMNDG